MLKQSSVVSTQSLLDTSIPVSDKYPLQKEVNDQSKDPFVFKSPIDSDAKKTLVNTFRFDHLIRSAIQLNSWITVKYHHKYQIYPLVGNDQEEYNTDEDLQKAVQKEADLKIEDQKKLLRYINTVISITDFETWLNNIWIDAQVGGRGAFFVETVKKTQKEFIKDVDLYEGTPILFKPLHWKFLDQTYIDLDTFRIKEIRYADPTMMINLQSRSGRPDYIPINDMIYLTCDDTNPLENSFGYGNSRLIPLVHLSAARRQATDKDIPELLTSFWNQTGVGETDDTSEANLAYLRKTLYQAGSIAIVNRQGFKFTPVPLKHDGWFIIQYLGLARQEVLRMLRVPDFLLNYTADSRSVIESAIGIWSDFVIESDRQQIFDQVYNQFFHKLVQLYLKGNNMDPKIANGIRVRPVYKRISIEDLLSKANSLELLIRRDVITKREARNIIDLSEKRIEDKEDDNGLTPIQKSNLAELEERLRIENEAKIDLSKKMPQQQNPNPFNRFGNNSSSSNNQQKNQNPNQIKETDAQKEASVKTPKTRVNAKSLGSRGAGAGRSV
jgi:hypothetical protein